MQFLLEDKSSMNWTDQVRNLYLTERAMHTVVGKATSLIAEYLI